MLSQSGLEWNAPFVFAELDAEANFKYVVTLEQRNHSASELSQVRGVCARAFLCVGRY